MALRARNFSRGWTAQCLLSLALVLAVGYSADAWGQGQSAPTDLEIRVTELHQEEPIEQALIELLRFPSGLLLTTYSDSSGRARFLGLQPNSYILRASKQGFRAQEVAVDIRRGDGHRQVSIQLQANDPVSAQAPQGMVSSRTLAIPAAAMTEFQRGAELLNGKKDPGASIPHFQRAIEAFPNYRDAYFLKGMAHLQMNGLEEAHTALAKAIEFDPKFLEAYHPIAVVLIGLKRYAEARNLLLRAMELDKAGWQWPFELARCYAAEGQWDKALGYGQMAHDRPDPPAKVHLLMADLYSNTGNAKKAIEELEKFATLDPNSPFMPRVNQVLSKLRAQKQN